MNATATDTADRIVRLDTLTLDGKPFTVDNITDDPTAARPSRLRLDLADLHGRAFCNDGARVIYLDAGAIVTFQPGGATHLADVTGRRPFARETVR